MDISSACKNHKFKMAIFVLVEVMTHNTGRWPIIPSVMVLRKHFFTVEGNRHVGKSLNNNNSLINHM